MPTAAMPAVGAIPAPAATAPRRPPPLLHPLARLPLRRGLSLYSLARRPLSSPVRRRAGVVVRSQAVAIEKETPENERPETFLRESDGGAAPVGDGHRSSVRARFERMIRETQDEVCAAIEVADGGGKFKEDVWSRPGGGGGISRVLQDGGVWEKAGVNVSIVYGMMPPEAYRAAKGDAGSSGVKPGPIPFFAAGISSKCPVKKWELAFPRISMPLQEMILSSPEKVAIM